MRQITATVIPERYELIPGRTFTDVNKIVLSTALMLLFQLSLWSSAHQPLWNPGSATPQTAYLIEDIEVSKAIFGELSEDSAAYFLLTVPDQFQLDIGLFRGADCDDAFYPELWFMREGRATNTPFESLANFQAEAIRGSWSSYRGHGLRGFKGPEINTRLEAGTYFVVVYAPQSAGYYLLSLGGLERFGGSEQGRAAIPRFNACG